MVPRPKKPMHGGARPGAGRRPEIVNPVRTFFYLSQEHAALLAAMAEKWGLSGRSAVLRKLLDEYDYR